jgi:hypothetical protein
MPSIRQLHELADRRMYIAKRNGGGIQYDLGDAEIPMRFTKRRRAADGRAPASRRIRCGSPPATG